MKETLQSIAERTGISPATISRVLNGKAEQYRISPKTAELIIREAQRCNYSPSMIAQSLRTNRTNSIGLLLPSFSNPYFAEISSTIISEANSKGYTTIALDCMENVENQRKGLSALVSRKVDGIIAAPCGNDPSIFEEVNNHMMPVVLVDRYFEGKSLSYVTSNNFRGAYDATSLLLRNGHSRIACIQGNPDSIPNRQRVNGYEQALRKSGVDVEPIVAGDSFSIQNGYLETRLLLSRENRPTAIFALSYTILLGVIKALQDMAVKIPEEMSIISFDDNISLDYMTPTITRVSQSVEEMGKLAVKLLFESIEGKTGHTTQLELSSKIISGDSIKPLI